MAAPSPLLAVPNVTAHPSTAIVPVAVLLHDGPLLCGFNVASKGLTADTQTFTQTFSFLSASLYVSKRGAY